jgi:hypothetical protein
MIEKTNIPKSILLFKIKKCALEKFDFYLFATSFYRRPEFIKKNKIYSKIHKNILCKNTNNIYSKIKNFFNSNINLTNEEYRLVMKLSQIILNIYRPIFFMPENISDKEKEKYKLMRLIALDLFGNDII